jgi:phosphoglycolate phosphatase
MATVAVTYGYCGKDLPPTEWQANRVVTTPAELRVLLDDIG